MPKDPHITGGIRHDWAAIKHEYVTDPDATLRKVAAKYGVRYSTIANKSKAEGWFATRKEYQSKLVSQAISQTGISQAKELAKSLDYLHSISNQVGEMLDDKDQFKKHFLQDETLAVKETITTKYDTKAMKDSLQMVKMIEDLSRSLLDIQRLEALQKHELDLARLQLERERFEFEKQKAEFTKPDSSNVIRIEGFEESWAE